MPEFACSPCKFPVVTETGASAFEAAWHREHMAHHMATFPNLDARSVANLYEFVVHATARENGCERLGHRSGETVACRLHGEIAHVPLPTSPWSDNGREAWVDHVMRAAAETA